VNSSGDIPSKAPCSRGTFVQGALAIPEKAQGPEHPNVATALDAQQIPMP